MDTVVHLTAIAPARGLAEESFERMSAMFEELFDGMLSRRGDQLLLTVYLPRCVDDSEQAVFDLIEEVQSSLDIEILELDLDLVTVSDIAERTGRTRQSIRMLVDGTRGAGGFPAPLGIPGGSKVWDWESVNSWLKRTSGLGDTEVGLRRALIFKINAMLAGRLSTRA